MIGKKERNLYLVLLIFLVHCHFSSCVSVDYISPARGGFRGGDITYVYGTGFTTFNEVTCMFNNRWAGFSAVIVSDSIVKCEVPIIDPSEIESLPLHVSVSLVFDGQSENTYYVTTSFLLGPTITSFSPISGFVQGGNNVTIRGYSLDNFQTANVFFDSSECQIITRTSTEIICKVPEGSFNQNALVGVTFNYQRQYYVQAIQTYHYGPLLTTVTPGCGSLIGGTFVTITGENLDDPTISSSQYPEDINPLVELSFTVNDDDDDSVEGDIRYFGISPSFDGTKVVFQTPNVEEAVFGEQVRLFVQFKGTNAKIAVTPKNAFRYGPIVYNSLNLPAGKTSIVNPSPSSGHVFGGDIITIQGCGFSQFPTNFIAPVVTDGGDLFQICNRGDGAGSSTDTLKVASCGDNTECEQITCVLGSTGCGYDTEYDIFVAFRPTNFTRYPESEYLEPSADEAPLRFSFGPQLSSIAPASVNYLGGETVTIKGKHFFATAQSTVSNPGWSVSVDINFGSSDLTVAAVIQSDTEVVFLAPVGFFNVDATVSPTFEGQSFLVCDEFPQELQFHYGPLCTGISPSNGQLSGGSAVTVSGSSFSSGAVPLVCLYRLNNFDCDVYEEGENLAYHDTTSVTFTTPSIRKNVPTNVGGNRIFGDLAAIVLYYPGIPSLYLDGDSNYVYCGDYRFGPEVNKIAPTKGPSGPAAENSPATPITVTGSAFTDPLYEDILVTLGETGAQTFSVSASTIQARTLWGGYASESEDVNVIFNQCNTTTSAEILHWGPEIISLSSEYTPVVSTYNPDGHLYGILPSGGQTVVAQISSIDPYYGYYYWDGFRYYFTGEVTIGGVAVSCDLDPIYEDDSEDGYGGGSEEPRDIINNIATFDLVCPTPALPFGTEAEFIVYFPNDCEEIVLPIVAAQKLFYTPRIDYFYPTFGLTSGGTDVTVIGEGFAEWESYTCYFGHYTNGFDLPDGSILPDGTGLHCEVPYHRGEFNTDVTVHIELSHELDMKAWAPSKFHYGPVCTNIVPSSGHVEGGYTAFITGDGFIDCKNEFSAPFSNCTFTHFGVFLSDPEDPTNNLATNITSHAITDTSFQIEIPAGTCMYEPNFVMYFPNVLVTDDSQRYVYCNNPDRDYFFHYGPLFSYQNSTYYRNGVSYGWDGDSITINGLNFNDPALTPAACSFGNVSATTTVVDDTQIVCTVPTGVFGTRVPVSVAWSGCSNDTSLVAGEFNYGPTIDSIFPSRGYVEDRANVTISGFAFECCGITAYEILWPPGALANSTTETEFIAPNSVRGPVPQNSNIDAEIQYIGVLFNSTLFSSQNTSYVTRTDSGDYLSYYYGPYVYDVSPKISSLSGRGVAITIQGEGFEDPYFVSTFCDFFSATDGFDDIGATPVIPIDDNTIICPVKTFNHECGSIDNIRPRWTRTGTTWRQNLGTTYYKTARNPNLIEYTDEHPLPVFVDVGSSTPSLYGPITYGPVITSIVELNQYELSSTQYNSPVNGGLLLQIYFDDLSDWIDWDGYNSFGSQKAICKFGNRYSDIVNIQYDDSDDIEYYVICEVPPLGEAGWDVSAPIEVILAPYIDEYTVISEDNPSFHWNWLPYAESMSRTVSQTTGREVIIIQGGGFCNSYFFGDTYDSVICNFGNHQAIEADITTSNVVTCQTPPNAPGYYDVELTFCSDDSCYTLGTFDRITVPQLFTYAGVTGISPLEGSICGGTSLTISGYGFSFYEQLTVRFGNEAEVPATYINDNTIVTTTPDLSPLHATTVAFAECANIIVYGKYGGSVNFPMVSPVSFEFGSPFPTAAVPNTADVDITTEIVVNGRYFGGGEISPNGEYLCKFGDLDPVPAFLYNYTENSGTPEVKYSLICYTPSTLDTPELTIGDYDLSILFSCEFPSFHPISIPFSFTQNPRVIQFNPVAGTEVGGTEIQISGRDFAGGSGYFCSFGTLGIDNQIVAAFYDVEHDVMFCQTPAKVVDNSQYVDFHISIDGGQTWVLADVPYQYLNAVLLCEQPFAPEPVVAASSILHPTLLLVVVIILSFF